MPESAESGGTAFNPTAVVGDARADMTELHRLQLADLEARELVERMQRKVEKCAGHLDSANLSLADAEEAAAEAAAALEAHQDTTGGADEEPDA